jgi:hypothetical protein
LADAPLTYAIVIAVFTLLATLLFIMRDKYSKLRSKHNQLLANKERLDVSSSDDMVREHNDFIHCASKTKK